MDAEFRRVKPKVGVLVRYPRNYAILPEAGAVVPWVGADGRYWRRRLNTGDVVIVVEEEKKNNFKGKEGK